MQKYIVIVLFSFTGHVRSYSSSPKIATIFESFMILNLIKKLKLGLKKNLNYDLNLLLNTNQQNYKMIFNFYVHIEQDIFLYDLLFNHMK